MNSKLLIGSICFAIILVVASFSSVASARIACSVTDKRISILQSFRNRLRNNDFEPGIYLFLFLLMLMGISLDYAKTMEELFPGWYPGAYIAALILGLAFTLLYLLYDFPGGGGEI